LLRHSEDQGVPERNAVKAVQIDGPENVGDFWKCDVKLGDQFDFPTGDTWVKVQFAGDRDEILLEHLPGHNSGNKLHRLEGELAHHWAVSVSGNWQLTFSFDGEDVIFVDYQDYH
jgi:hypothetical protein